MSRPTREKGESVKIRKSTHQKLSAYCKKNGLYAIHFISDAIEEKLEQKLMELKNMKNGVTVELSEEGTKRFKKA